MTAVLLSINNNIISEPDTSNIIVETSLSNLIQEGSANTIIITDNTSNIITSIRPASTVIVSGMPGPQGPAGVNEEDVTYSKRIDNVSDSEMYKGEAAVGSTTASFSWRIQKIVFAIDGDVSITWADGNANFDNSWDNRLTYSYS